MNNWYDYERPERMPVWERRRFDKLADMSVEEKQAEVVRLRREADVKSISELRRAQELAREARYLSSWIDAEQRGDPRPVEVQEQNEV